MIQIHAWTLFGQHLVIKCVVKANVGAERYWRALHEEQLWVPDVQALTEEDCAFLAALRVLSVLDSPARRALGDSLTGMRLL